jgi:hypothetical protein
MSPTPFRYKLVVAKLDGSTTCVAQMNSLVEILNRLASCRTALTFVTYEPFALAVLNNAKQKVETLQTESMTLAQVQTLNAIWFYDK